MGITKLELKPHYGTVGNVFGGIPLKKPLSPNYVELAKTDLRAKFEAAYDLLAHTEYTREEYVDEMYENFSWVDCADCITHTMSMRSDINTVVLRYCANADTIPNQVPEKDIFVLWGTSCLGRQDMWCDSTNMAFGYGYYIKKYTDPSPIRIIEQDLITDKYMVRDDYSSNTYHSRSEFMYYYQDEFTIDDYEDACDEEMRINIEKHNQQMRENEEYEQWIEEMEQEEKENRERCEYSDEEEDYWEEEEDDIVQCDSPRNPNVIVINCSKAGYDLGFM